MHFTSISWLRKNINACSFILSTQLSYHSHGSRSCRNRQSRWGKMLCSSRQFPTSMTRRCWLSSANHAGCHYLHSPSQQCLSYPVMCFAGSPEPEDCRGKCHPLPLILSSPALISYFPSTEDFIHSIQHWKNYIIQPVLSSDLHSERVSPSMFENFITNARKREQRIVQMSHNILLYMLALWLH